MDEAEDTLRGFLQDDGRAIYASRPSESRGRLHEEPPSKTRSDFQRDRDRVIHSRAFRRLKHKTQVFVYHEGDHYRTRLSHSIEVAQVARSLARILYADEDLAEVCALAHDLGHTPFAHVGEDALKECMLPYGGFDHNDQTLRVVTYLEQRYPRFDGLNLTWESIEGLVKHNGPVVKKGKKTEFQFTLSRLKDQTDMMLDSHASIEAQIAGISDDIAYNSHDIDDGLSAGYFTLDDLKEVPFLYEIVERTRAEFPGVEESRIRSQVVRELMGYMIADVRRETEKNLAEINPQSPDDVRRAGKQIVAFSEEMEKHDEVLRRFLWDRFYLHKHVARLRFKVYKVVQGLFAAFMDYDRALPKDWRKSIENVPKGISPTDWRARVVADYIANMTDRYAILTHRELFDPYADIQ
ncbi:MAG: deoxyguanosinetriphosphate triphosphohydrolase [Micavibrio sp.]|nr:MAG: deoxyguanosinetriphosphate triphosphohydrolase [Micavibrio sp.]